MRKIDFSQSRDEVQVAQRETRKLPNKFSVLSFQFRISYYHGFAGDDSEETASRN